MSIRIFTRFSKFALIGLGLSVMAAGCSETSERPAAAPTVSETGAVSTLPFSPDRQDWPHDISDIPPDPKVKYGRLDNGLRYAVLPTPDQTDSVSIQLNIAAGYNQEPETAYGVAHLLEHIAFRGKQGGDDSSIIHDLQSDGVGFGSDFNGYTQPDNTYYRLNLQSGNSKSLATGLETMRVLVDLPDLTVENMEAEKKIVLAELKQRDSIQARASQSYLAFSNPGQPRYKVSGIGTPESLAEISLSDLQDFKAAHYVPDQAFLIIVGEVELKKTERFIRSHFADWKSETRPKHTPGASAPFLNELTVDVSYEAPKTKTQLNAIEIKAPTRKSDTYEARKRSVLQKQMTEMLVNRINKRVDDEGAVSWIRLVRKRGAEGSADGVKMAGRNLPLAMTIFEEERLRAVQFGFTAEELDYVTEKRRAAFERRDEAADQHYAWREANRLRTQFTGGFVYTNTKQELEFFNEMAAELTLEDFNRAVRETWSEFDPNYWTQSSRPMTTKVKSVKSARVKAQEKVLTPLEQPQDTGFQKAVFDGVGKVTSRDVYRREKLQRLLFENGVRLNYTVSDKEPDEIRIVVSLQEIETRHILDAQAAIAEKVLSISRADIEGVNADIMDRHFVGKRADFHLGIVEDRLVLSASTNSDNLRENLELISTFLVKFDRDSKDYEKAFDKKIRRIKTTTGRSPLISGLINLNYAYSGQSGVYKSTTVNRPSVTSKVDEKIEDIIKTASVQVGIVGDFDAEALELAFASTLGAMPLRPDVKTGVPEVNEDVTLIDPGLTTLTYRGPVNQMALFYCWPDKASDSAQDYANSVLLSAIFGNRLLANLREERGVSYAPQLFYESNRAFPNLGYLCHSTQIDPEDEMKGHDGFQEIIRQFKTTPISSSELERAREPVLRQLKSRLNSEAYFPQFVSIAYSEPENWAYQKSLPKVISKTSLKSLNKAAAATYDKSNLHIFRVQHYQGSRAVDDKNLEVKSYLGDTEAQYILGKKLIFSLDPEKIERGVELLNQAGEGGKREAFIRLGQYHLGKSNPSHDDLKLGAATLESSLPSVEASFRLGELYFHHYDVFPDVEDERIMELLTESAEGGSWRGQHFLAERLKDGTMTPRDEIGALKWALISNHTRSGKLSIEDEKGIARFITGLTEEEIETAEGDAKSWVYFSK